MVHVESSRNMRVEIILIRELDAGLQQDNMAGGHRENS